MRLGLPSAFALTLVLLLYPVEASHCTTYSTSETDIGAGVIVIEIPSPASGISDYMAVDLCQPDCVFSISLYAETNGLPGLQRNDVERDDTCHGAVPADQPVSGG